MKRSLTCIYLCVLTVWGFTSWAHADTQILAFPGAEGFGRFTQGGRGGRVIEVTNLNDSGPGSFRAAVEASGPRTVVFRVSGTIVLDHKKKPPRISHPFITIAGQTAPGDGITIKGGMLDIRASHVIARHLRIRPGPTVHSPESGDAIQIFAFLNNVHNVIIDHVSMSWTTDETFSTYASPFRVSDVTLQWSILSESLNCSTHPEGCHSTGLLVGGGGGGDVSIHHNLLAHHNYRFPVISGGNVDLVNNVMYNWGVDATQLQPFQHLVKVNVINNSYLPGLNTISHQPIRLEGNAMGSVPFAPDSAVYLEGNIHPRLAPSGAEDQTLLLKIRKEGGLSLVSEPFAYPLGVITDPLEAKADVLANAGATLPKRDAIDARIVNDVLKGTGRMINDPSNVGGWLKFSSGTPPEDSDHDGMPDVWELAWGLAPKSDADGVQDTDGDGYTNLEEYLNGTEPGKDLAPPAVPQGVEIVNK